MNGIGKDEEAWSLSSPNYDPLIHLNEIFSSPSSLASLPAIQLHLSTYLHQLDKEIEVEIPKQREQQAETQKQINELHLELEDLFKNVEAVRTKAEKADRVMGNLTGGIRRLDGGKRNLTTSMTALKRLQMLSITPFFIMLTLSDGIRTTTHL
jgi:vacuolar protein sorting-associated protein 53